MTQLTFDQVHSSLEFSVKHLMVSKVKGTFENYDVVATGDANDLSTLQVEATIDASSINTKNADRDGHLKSADFFDTENYPEIKFVSTKITDNEITGNLTIKDQTHEETFHLESNGISKNPMDGSMVTGFVVSGSINREKYGLTWNQTLETGGVMVSKEVKFEVSAEFGVQQ